MKREAVVHMKNQSKPHKTISPPPPPSRLKNRVLSYNRRENLGTSLLVSVGLIVESLGKIKYCAKRKDRICV